MSVSAVALAIADLMLDSAISLPRFGRVAGVLAVGLEARAVLAIAGLMVTVASLVFSMTLVTLQLARPRSWARA